MYALALALSGLAFVILLIMWFALVDLTKQQYAKFVLDHFQSLVGLPMAAILSFILVTFLKQRSGEGIEFKGIGFHFKGPSGEVVLWILCYSVITLSIAATWK